MINRRHFLGIGSLTIPVMVGAAQIYLPRRRPPAPTAAPAADSDSFEYWKETEQLPQASFATSGFEYWTNGGETL